MTPPDAAARRRALSEHDRDMLVEASAGTGKTAVIAGRAALLLASGRSPAAIAAITFAEAAAAELAARIRAFTESLANGDVPPQLAVALPGRVHGAQQAHAAEALQNLDRLTATTIHGFCREIVLTHAVAAGIDQVRSSWTVTRLTRCLSACFRLGSDDVFPPRSTPVGTIPSQFWLLRIPSMPSTLSAAWRGFVELIPVRGRSRGRPVSSRMPPYSLTP